MGTPQSSHLDLMKNESHMSDMGRRSATQADQQNAADEFKTLPVSLADLQDDDKSSLESGQVSPEPFNEREEVLPGATHHRFNAPTQG